MKMMNWMLALAAVALMAAACSSSTTAAAGTPAADVTTTADTKAPTDTAAPADTVAAADTVTATDTAAATDAAAGEKGCLAAADKTYLDGLNADATKKAAFGDASLTCTLKKGCLAKSGDAAQQSCIADCLAAATGLTTNCAACYGGYSWCGAKKCLAQCAADPLSQPCSDCLGTNCDPVKNDCAAGK